MHIPGDFFHVKEPIELTNDLYRYMAAKVEERKSMQKESNDKIDGSAECNSYIDFYLKEADKVDNKYGQNSHLFHGRFALSY